MLPIFAFMVRSLPTAPPPYGALAHLPEQERLAPEYPPPEDCDLEDALHAALQSPSADALRTIEEVQRCRRSGAIDPMDTWPAFRLGQQLRDEARDEADPGLAALKLVRLYRYGQDLRYGTLVSQMVGVALELEALAGLEGRAGSLDEPWRRAVAATLRELAATEPRFSLVAEAEAMDEYLGSPYGWLGRLEVRRGRATCRGLEPALAHGSEAEIVAALDAAILREEQRWIPSPSSNGIAQILRDGMVDAARLRDGTTTLLERLE